MQISIDELTKIQKTLDKFPEVKTFKITNIPGPIGNIMSITFEYYVNETICNLTVEITGVENW